jgi:2-methylcitrate dehydratase PrpD
MGVARPATTRELASFLARLCYEDAPDETVERTKELFLDWVGAALAGRNERLIRILERFADEMALPRDRARS